MTKEIRTQLENLSLLVFGSKTKYKKLLDRGEPSNLEETLPDGTIRKYRGYKYPLVSEIKERMEKMFADKLQKQKDDKEREEAVKKAHETAVNNLKEENV